MEYIPGIHAGQVIGLSVSTHTHSVRSEIDTKWPFKVPIQPVNVFVLWEENKPKLKHKKCELHIKEISFGNNCTTVLPTLTSHTLLNFLKISYLPQAFWTRR